MVQRNPQQVSATSAGHDWSHGHTAQIHNLRRYCRMSRGCEERNGTVGRTWGQEIWTQTSIYLLYHHWGGNLSMPPTHAMSQSSWINEDSDTSPVSTSKDNLWEERYESIWNRETTLGIQFCFGELNFVWLSQFKCISEHSNLITHSSNSYFLLWMKSSLFSIQSCWVWCSE